MEGDCVCLSSSNGMDNVAIYIEKSVICIFVLLLNLFLQRSMSYVINFVDVVKDVSVNW